MATIVTTDFTNYKDGNSGYSSVVGFESKVSYSSGSVIYRGNRFTSNSSTLYNLHKLTLSYEPGIVYIYNDTTKQYESYIPYIHNGTTWEQYAPYIYDNG